MDSLGDRRIERYFGTVKKMQKLQLGKCLNTRHIFGEITFKLFPVLRQRKSKMFFNNTVYMT